MQNMRDVSRNEWNKVSQNFTEEFSWKLRKKWKLNVYKNSTVTYQKI